MIKPALFLIPLLALGCLPAQSSDLRTLLDTALKRQPEYQQMLSRYEQEKALYTIEKSLTWFDLNFNYQQYDNEFVREEIRNTLEHSTVEEKDKRWAFELNKQLFPKDFDDVSLAIGSRLDLLRHAQNAKLAYLTASADVFDDLIDWFEAERMTALLQTRLGVLQSQNQLLEELDLQGQIDPEMLIENLEEINDKEVDLSRYKRIVSQYSSKYGDILPDFLIGYHKYVNTGARADTLLLYRQIDAIGMGIDREFRKLRRNLKLSHTRLFLPELNLSLSYNWRENRQNWLIEQNDEIEKMIRNQDEEFPEARIEFSLPFSLISNTGGKLALLKAYEQELDFRSRELRQSWQKFAADRISGYHAAGNDLRLKSRLKELHGRNLNVQTRKFKEEPALLGSNPELTLQKAALKADEAQITAQMAEMRLYKEIFLINSLREEAE